MLLALAGAAGAAVAGDLHWAAAEGTPWRGPALNDTYGAAWNYASLEEAESAAREACRERTPEWWNHDKWQGGDCGIASSGTNSCFFIVKGEIHDENVGKYTVYAALAQDHHGSSLLSRAQAEAAAKREAAKFDGRRADAFATFENGRVELVECAGVQ